MDIINVYEFDDQSTKSCLNFNCFWNAISHFKSNLRKLSLEDFAISFRNFSFEGKFPSQLTNIKLSSFIIGSDNFINFLQCLINGLYHKKQTNYSVNISQLVLDDETSCRRFFEMLSKNARKIIPFSLKLDVRNLDPNNFGKVLLGFLSEGKKIPLSLDVINILMLSKSTKNQLESFFKCRSGPLQLLTLQKSYMRFLFNSNDYIDQNLPTLSIEEEMENEEPPRNQPRLEDNFNDENSDKDNEEDWENDEFGRSSVDEVEEGFYLIDENL